jgi:4-carboxymuconolactone decarboxylase
MSVPTGWSSRSAGNVPRMDTPRIAPLPESEWEGDTAGLLHSLRRGDRPVLNIFATLARHPDLFTDWLGFGARLLAAGTLSPRHRELAILRTSWNTGAEYEWGHHARIAERSGLGEEEIARVARREVDGWEPVEAAVLRAADELHADARISDETWAALAEGYDERQLIELCMLVGQYHVVAFALNSLGVPREPGVAGFPTA